MKNIYIYQGIALLAMALTTAACQNELNEDTTQPQPGGKVNMTIRATQGMAPQTRTIYEDKLGIGTAGSVVVKWEGGTAANAPVEKIKVFGYANGANDFTTPQELLSTPTTLSTNGLSIDFTGTVTQADNYLAVYPANNSELDRKGFITFTFLGQEQDCTTGKELAHLKKYDIMLGTPTGTNNYTFKHKAIMLRFDLTLPTAESVKKVTLATSIDKGIATDAYIGIGYAESLQFDEGEAVKEVSLGITKHTASTTLKAYMMVPSIDVDNATLTITVATASGNNYEGKLVTAVGTPALESGKCHTLRPNKLVLTNKITIPPVIEGGLKNVLNLITPANGQTELALTGTVNNTDIAALASFLQETKSKNITILDLSGITITNSAPVTGFKDCIKVIEVILPDYADAIGDNAFEGCTALTTVTQNETTSTSNPNTRASMPSRVKTVGKAAFKGCTAMTEMFLHNAITKVGDNAFAGCTALRALVFEGTRTVSTETGTDKINLGANILDGCTKEGLNILLPYITETEATKAATYKKALGKPTRYSFLSNLDYSEVTNEVRLDSESYAATVSDGSSLDDFKPGGSLGQ